jgi:hypothetical protein
MNHAQERMVVRKRTFHSEVNFQSSPITSCNVTNRSGEPQVRAVPTL